jgi:hypothetical protein
MLFRNLAVQCVFPSLGVRLLLLAQPCPSDGWCTMRLPGRLVPAVGFWIAEADEAVDFIRKSTCRRTPAVWFTIDSGFHLAPFRPSPMVECHLLTLGTKHVKTHCSGSRLPFCLLLCSSSQRHALGVGGTFTEPPRNFDH